MVVDVDVDTKPDAPRKEHERSGIIMQKKDRWKRERKGSIMSRGGVG